MSMKYFIKTFGCQQNSADSERIASACESRGMKKAQSMTQADYIVINTCMVRHSAENRVYGLVENLGNLKSEGRQMKIVVTGCMVGLAFRDKTGKYLERLRSIMPEVDEFMPIEEVGFDHPPVRQDILNAWVPISNGCNNFCTFCVVPFTRGREISRPFEDIIRECQKLKENGFKNVTLLGQNVNSYGADLLVGEKNIQVMRDIDKVYFQSSGRTSAVEEERSDGKTQEVKLNGKIIKPTYVKHLGRYRIPTLFPSLLEQVAKIGFEKVDFVSSNPWDFSDELIEVIAKNKNITRTIHLPVQSGDSNILKRMNRWYSAEDYFTLVKKLKIKIKNLKLTTDIIVGFCGETDEQFKNTVKLVKKVNFSWAFVARYSVRPMTAATRVLTDDVPDAIKKKRWLILDKLINRPHLKKYRN